MRLGEMLIRDGRLSEDQLQQSLAIQAEKGGRIGTVLFEAGLIDLDALTIYLGLDSGIPIASGATLEKAKKIAVQLLTPEQATKLRAVPIVIQDRQLIVAVADPHDMAKLEAITQITGYPTIPRVAPELRVIYYIERYFGVPRPQRFAGFGDLPRGNRPVAEGLPAGPLPGLPPITHSPVKPPNPAPALRISKRVDTSAVIEEDSLLLEELESDAEEQAVVAEPSQRIVMSPPPKPTQSIDFEAAKTRLQLAESRQEIAEALLSYAATHFTHAVLAVVRDDYLFGWKGVNTKDDRLESMMLPLEASSVFATAVDSGFYRGPLIPSVLHNYLLKVIEAEEPAQVVTFPISIANRNVNLFYGHSHQLLNDEIESELKELADEASEAYVGLIRRTKRLTQ